MAEEQVAIREYEYNELLLQAIAVIERDRVKVARHIAATASNPLVLNDTRICRGFNGNIRKSSMFCQQADVDRLSNV